jgi:hypothetical protein
VTLPEFEERLLALMDARAKGCENVMNGQSKANVKEELQMLSLQIENGDIEIPVYKLLPGNLGVEVDIAAGAAIIAAGTRMDDAGVELTDTTGGELQFPSQSSGDWLSNSASPTAPPSTPSRMDAAHRQGRTLCYTSPASPLS